MDKMREAFEKEFKIPIHLEFSEQQNEYVALAKFPTERMRELESKYNVRWEAWQAAQSNQKETESYLLNVIADIRQVTGLGSKPMLSELAEAIRALLSDSGSQD